MKDDCLFCKIIKKEIASEIIYEDDKVFIFLDINPTTNGDTLIIPKKHFETIFDIDDELLIYMNKIYKKFYSLYKDKLHCDGLSLTTNLDYAQEIKHFHMHFIPRYKDDEVKYLSNKNILKDIEEIKNIINKKY